MGVTGVRLKNMKTGETRHPRRRSTGSSSPSATPPPRSCSAGPAGERTSLEAIRKVKCGTDRHRHQRASTRPATSQTTSIARASPPPAWAAWRRWRPLRLLAEEDHKKGPPPDHARRGAEDRGLAAPRCRTCSRDGDCKTPRGDYIAGDFMLTRSISSRAGQHPLLGLFRRHKCSRVSIFREDAVVTTCRSLARGRGLRSRRSALA